MLRVREYCSVILPTPLAISIRFLNHFGFVRARLQPFPKLSRIESALAAQAQLPPVPKLRRKAITAALVTLFAAASMAHAQDAVVRLSYVAGSVQIAQNGTVQFDKAVANMPLFEGSQVTTAGDGQAEIEFADGSVARLTPNSSLMLTHVQRAGATGRTDVELINGLGYFELNVGQGQRFTVQAGPATAHPEENSIFRVDLDTTPGLAVFQGVLHVDGGSGSYSTEVDERQALRFDPNDAGQYTIANEVTPESWDQWNIDRDDAIAREAQTQTTVRSESSDPQDPGWNDLDAYGDWYPVDGYGNVWIPDDVDANWDPFGYGYWATYPTYGVTWISGYPWGWLPYHCGAWNYFPFGWGWVPGGCGLGWSPIVTVWNIPPGYRLPVWPKGPFPISGHPHPMPLRPLPQHGLTLVDRGAPARGPWGPGVVSRPVATHTQPIRLGGNEVMPIAHVPAPGLSVRDNRMTTVTGAHVGIPVAHPVQGAGSSGGGMPIHQMSTPAPHPTGESRPNYAPPARAAEPARSAPAPAAPAGRPH
jgi:ferric-dicitrate binding protein FerR (iron transport regulator)